MLKNKKERLCTTFEQLKDVVLNVNTPIVNLFEIAAIKEYNFSLRRQRYQFFSFILDRYNVKIQSLGSS